MVRASEEAAAAEEKKSKIVGHRSNLKLTDSGIYGNTFVFNFVGHDSITITLAYMITHLAAHPEVQDWVAEEISEVCADHPESTTVSYRDTFPRLKRGTTVVASFVPSYTLNPYPLVLSSFRLPYSTVYTAQNHFD